MRTTSCNSTGGSNIKTCVVHCTKSSFDVYIGRRSGKFKEDSIWHNPCRIGKDGTRQEVIAKYRSYILGRPDLLALLPTLKGKVLGCWCKPDACHGDVLVGLVEGIDPAPEPVQESLF
jgi:hypothetical protein